MSTGRMALALLAAVAVCPASAATLTTTVSKENKTIVMLTGEIVKGDAEKLKAIMRWPRLFGQFFRFDEWNICRG